MPTKKKSSGRKYWKAAGKTVARQGMGKIHRRFGRRITFQRWPRMRHNRDLDRFRRPTFRSKSGRGPCREQKKISCRAQAFSFCADAPIRRE